MIIFHIFLRIIALLKTPRPDLEGSMTRILKAWTLENQVGARPTYLLIVPKTSLEGNGLG